jgi:hypothetical protein
LLNYKKRQKQESTKMAVRASPMENAILKNQMDKIAF